MILSVTHTIAGTRRTNRVRIDGTDPEMVGAEICLNLAETFKCDPRDIVVENIEADRGDPGHTGGIVR